MVERFLDAKNVIIRLQECFENPLSDEQWTTVEQFFDILKPCNVATLQFQTQNAIITELYKNWLECDLNMEAMKS